jgi:hypothetical protein
VRLALALGGLLVVLAGARRALLGHKLSSTVTNYSSVAVVITTVVRTVIITIVVRTAVIAVIIRMIVGMVVVVIVGMVVVTKIGMIVVRMVSVAVRVTIAHRMATSVRSSDPSWAAAHGHECNI